MNVASGKSAAQQTGARQRPARPSQPDHPYTMTLPDGRTEFLEIPGRWVTRDRSGETGFLPQAVYLLDRVRALAISASDRPPRPGYIRSLRQALGMTQADFAARVGVDKLTVSRWERGAVRPRPESLGAIERLRKRAARRGVTVPA